MEACSTRAAQGRGDEGALGGPVGRGEAAGAAVLVRGGRAQDGQRGQPAGSRPLQDRHRAALPPPVAVAARVERLAAPHGRQRLPCGTGCILYIPFPGGRTTPLSLQHCSTLAPVRKCICAPPHASVIVKFRSWTCLEVKARRGVLARPP